MINLKKFISLLLTISLTLIVNLTSSHAMDLNTHQRAVNNLLNSGWTTEDIKDLLTEEALLTYADVLDISSTEKYYKITETFPSNKLGFYSLSSSDIINTKVTEMNKSDFYSEVELHKTMKRNLMRSFTNSKEVTTYDGYMKMRVSKSKINTKNYQISFKAEWLIPPKNTKIDIIGLGHDGTLCKNSDYDTYFSYNAKFDYYDVYGIPSEKNQKFVSYEPEGLNNDTYGTVIKYNLLNDRRCAGTGDNLRYSMRVKSHKIYMHYRVIVNNTDTTDVSIQGNYFHQQKTISVSPSISYTSVGLSFSNKSYFKEMTPNPLLTWNIYD